MNFDEIFERIKFATNTRTQMELADALEIRQSSISDAKRRNSVPAEWYMKLFESFGLNPDWLKKGGGPMYLRTDQGYAAMDALPDAAARRHIFESAVQNNEPEARSAVVTVHSPLEPYNPEKPASSVGRLNIPLSFSSPGLYVIRVEASSMEPNIRRGSHVGLDTAQRTVISGELYGVNLPYEGVGLRRVYLDSANGCYILRAENPAHPEATMPIGGTGAFIVGRVVWLLQKM